MFAQDEGGEGLVGYADIQVNLKDINDNAPIFLQEIYHGNVTESGPSGEKIFNFSFFILLKSIVVYTLSYFNIYFVHTLYI